VSDGRNIERGHDMTNTTGLEPVVDEMDRRAALVLGAAAAASVLAGGADASAQGAAGAVKSYNPVTVATSSRSL
jgi:hypothetical protein